jgi:hypothetical protein
VCTHEACEAACVEHERQEELEQFLSLVVACDERPGGISPELAG